MGFLDSPSSFRNYFDFCLLDAPVLPPDFYYNTLLAFLHHFTRLLCSLQLFVFLLGQYLSLFISIRSLESKIRLLSAVLHLFFESFHNPLLQKVLFVSQFFNCSQYLFSEYFPSFFHSSFTFPYISSVLPALFILCDSHATLNTIFLMNHLLFCLSSIRVTKCTVFQFFIVAT